MSELLFHTPWWLPVALIGIGGIVFWTGNRRQESNVRNTGMGMILAAAAVMALSYLVETDLEACVRLTKTLVRSVENRDWPTVKSVLSPTTGLSVMGATDVYVNRDEILGGAEHGVEQYGVKNIRILGTTAEQTDTVITITMSILSEQTFTQGFPINTKWQFEWQQSGKNWSMTRITCIQIHNMTGEQAMRQFPRP